jgi:hypothetical protein
MVSLSLSVCVCVCVRSTEWVSQTQKGEEGEGDAHVDRL